MAPLQRSKSVIQADQLQIQHFIHQHLLHKAFMTSEFNCDGCNTGGDGVRFRCSVCDFDLHEQCATASHRIISNLHPQHHLILVNRPGGSHVCDICKGVTNGLSYTCESQSCQFNVHNLCINHQQQMPSMVFGGNNGVINSQPVMVNHHQHTMQFGGVNTSQPVMVNHQQKQGIATTELGGYDHGVNNNQTQMINHSYQQQQQQQGVPMTGFGGYNGVNNHQPVMVNHLRQQPMQGVASVAFGGNQGVNYLREQPKEGVASAAFGGNHGFNNNQSQMINHQQQRFGGYQGGMNSQPVMVNHHQQQQQQVAFNNNQQLITNHHQQFQQQHGIALPTTVGGYNVVNNNQTVMISHPPPPPPPPPQQLSNGYTKVGKLAANILSTSLIGIPLFNSRN